MTIMTDITFVCSRGQTLEAHLHVINALCPALSSVIADTDR